MAAFQLRSLSRFGVDSAERNRTWTNKRTSSATLWVLAEILILSEQRDLGDPLEPIIVVASEDFARALAGPAFQIATV